MKILIVNFPQSNHVARLHILDYILSKNNVDVTKLYCNLWGDNKTRMKLAKKPWLMLFRILPYFAYLRHTISTINNSSYDRIIIGYPAYLDAFFIQLFCKKKIPIIFIDYFLSIYDTVVLDRKMFSSEHIISKLLFFIERKLLKAFENIIVDTNTNAARYSKLFKINEQKFKRVFVGSRLILKEFDLEQNSAENQVIKIGWVGSFIPLHGIKTILKTAKLLKNENYEFNLIGEGQLFNESKQFVSENNLSNVVLHGKLDYEQSMSIISGCDICLGIFGGSDKSLSVIPFKLFDYLYLNKKVITQNSKAIAEILPNDNIILSSPNANNISVYINNLKHYNTSYKNITNNIMEDLNNCFALK